MRSLNISACSLFYLIIYLLICRPCYGTKCIIVIIYNIYINV